MSSIYIPYVVSILTDYFMTRSGDSFIEMTHLMKHIQTIRRMEVPPWFFLTRDRSGDVPKEQWGNGYETPDGIHSETIRNVMNFTHILERKTIPHECVSLQSSLEFYKKSKLTLDMFRSNPFLFEGFFQPLIVCVALAEAAEHPRVPCKIRIPDRMRVQKGISEMAVEVKKHLLTDRVNLSLTEELMGKLPPSVDQENSKLLVCHWRLSPDHKVRSPLFVQGSIDHLAVPFKFESTADGNLWIQTYAIEMKVKITDEFDDSIVIHPWARMFGNDEKFMSWKSTMEIDMPNLSISSALNYSSSESLAIFVPRVEANIRELWGWVDFPAHVERPSVTNLCADLSGKFVWCIDMPRVHPSIKSPSQIKFTPPELPFFTRELLIDAVHKASERHVAHMIVRGNEGVVTIPDSSLSGYSTVTYGTRDDFVMVFVSTSYRVGSMYRIGHVAMVSRNSDHTREFLRWYKDHEDVLIALAGRVSKLCMSLSIIVPPIPVRRVQFRDEYTPIVLRKKIWKLAGCYCSTCQSIREEPLVPVLM